MGWRESIRVTFSHTLSGRGRGSPLHVIVPRVHHLLVHLIQLVLESFTAPSGCRNNRGLVRRSLTHHVLEDNGVHVQVNHTVILGERVGPELEELVRPAAAAVLYLKLEQVVIIISLQYAKGYYCHTLFM